jgi:hypothetical protein
METKSPWPFHDAPGSVCITTKAVTSRRLPIVYALRSTDDEGELVWHFQCAEEFQMADAQLVRLSTIFAVDPSVSKLADLPMGYEATRDSPGDPWERLTRPGE